MTSEVYKRAVLEREQKNNTSQNVNVSTNLDSGKELAGQCSESGLNQPSVSKEKNVVVIKDNDNSSVGILSLFNKEDVQEKNDGSYKTFCPDCGLQGGREPGLILFKNNTWFCHSSQRHGGIVEMVAIQNKIIRCIDCNETGEKRKVLDKEQFKQTLDIIKEFKSKLLGQILKESTQKKHHLEESDIKFTEKHLPYFNLIDKAIPLEGEVYKPLKKEIYYSLISTAINQNLMIIKAGNIKTDKRLHTVLVMPSGSGKKELKEGYKRTLQKFNPLLLIDEPRSPHPQQLIGKVLKRKEGIGKDKKEVIYKKKGYLGSDILIMEEASELFNSNEKNDKDNRDHIIVALDTYGENLVQKNNIDDLPIEEEKLAYFPKVNFMAMLQPTKIQEMIFIRGLGRRVSWVYRRFPERTDNKFFERRLFSTISTDEYEEEFANYMKSINQLSGSWSFDTDIYEEFILLHRTLLEQGYLQGGKAAEFTKIQEFPLQNILLKYSVFQAAANLRTNITKQDVQRAFIDVLERFTFELKFVEDCVQGNLDSGMSWNGAVDLDQQALEWLYYTKAISKEESQITISQYQKAICDIYGVSFRRARDRYNKLKVNGWVEDYRGQGSENCVWLTFTPKIKGSTYLDNELLSPKYQYQRVLNIINGTEEVLPEIRTPKEKTDRETQFYETEECENIKTEISKDDVLNFVKENKGVSYKEIFNKFGTGSLKFKNELLKEGVIFQNPKGGFELIC